MSLGGTSSPGRVTLSCCIIDLPVPATANPSQLPLLRLGAVPGAVSGLNAVNAARPGNLPRLPMASPRSLRECAHFATHMIGHGVCQSNGAVKASSSANDTVGEAGASASQSKRFHVVCGGFARGNSGLVSLTLSCSTRLATACVVAVSRRRAARQMCAPALVSDAQLGGLVPSLWTPSSSVWSHRCNWRRSRLELGTW